MMATPKALATREEFLVQVFVTLGEDVMHRYFAKRNECVAAVRIVKECLEPFGFQVEPVPVKMIVQSEKHLLAYVVGASPEEQERMNAKAAHHERPSGTLQPWNGHVIAIINRRWVLDPTFDQASAPDRGMVIDGMLLIDAKGIQTEPMEPQNLAVTAHVVMDNDLELKVTYHPTGDVSFLDSPAWETDHIEPAIGIIRRGLEIAERKRGVAIPSALATTAQPFHQSPEREA